MTTAKKAPGAAGRAPRPAKARGDTFRHLRPDMGEAVIGRLDAALESVERHRLELRAAAETAATTADRSHSAEHQRTAETLRTTRVTARGQLAAAEERTRTAVTELFRGGSPYAWAGWDSPVWTAEYREPIAPAQVVSVAGLHMRKPDGYATFPLVLPAAGTGILVTHDTAAAEAAQSFAQSYVVRALAASPPGALQLRLLDPAGFGQHLGPLARLPEPLVVGGVRAIAEEITSELRAVLDHIQRLSNSLGQGETLVDRWRKGTAGREALQLVVAAGLPLGLRADDFERLCTIARAGRRCGVAVVVVHDSERPGVPGVAVEELREHVHHFHVGSDGFATWMSLPSSMRAHVKIACPEPPGGPQVRFLTGVLAPAAREGAHRPVRLRYFLQQQRMWTETSENGLSAVVGRDTDGGWLPVTLGYGDDVAAHGLVAGPSGSGKSTLLHTLVHALAWRYGPDDLELHLLDMRSGNDLAEYAPRRGTATLPQVRSVGLRPDPTYALGVLRHLMDQARQREELFTREAGRHGRPVTDLRSYRAVTGRGLPRVLLVADEFPRMARGDAEAEVWDALETLSRTGPRLGIHLLLSTQTLTSVGTSRVPSLASVLDRTRLRIALRCPPEELSRVLGRRMTTNPAADRRGAGVLNEHGGIPGHDVVFQTAILDTPERARVRTHVAGRRRTVAPARIARGPSGVDLADVVDVVRAAKEPRLFLGAPVGVDPPAVSVRLTPGEGRGLLLSAPDEQLAVAEISSSLVALAMQDASEVGLTVVDLLPEDLPARRPLDDVLAFLGDRILHLGLDRFVDLPRLIAQRARTQVVAVLGLQHAGIALPLRPDDEHPTAALEWLFTSAPARGVHPVVWIDEPDRMRTIGRESENLQLRAVAGVDPYVAGAFLGRQPPAAAPPGRLWFRDLAEDRPPLLVDPFVRPAADLVGPGSTGGTGGTGGTGASSGGGTDQGGSSRRAQRSSS